MNKQFKWASLLWTGHLKLPILPTAFQLPTYLQRKGPFKASHPSRVAGTPNTLTASSQRGKEGGKKAKEIFWPLASRLQEFNK